MHGDLGIGECRQIGGLVVELQSGLAAREDELPGFIVELVAKHARAISQMLEHAAQLRRTPGQVQGFE